MPVNPIYRFRAELMDTDLKIWREFEVVNNYPMSKFGYIIMSIFRMEGNHLWSFEVPYKEKQPFNIEAESYKIEIINPYDDMQDEEVCLDAAETKLSKVMTEIGDTIVFNYDFGDDWNIKITLEKIYTDKSVHGREFPRVLSGEGYGIIEDCGGVGGLEEIVKAYASKSGEEYQNYVDVFGKKDFNLEEFDVSNMTYIAKCANCIFKEAYEGFDD